MFRLVIRGGRFDDEPPKRARPWLGRVKIVLESSDGRLSFHTFAKQKLAAAAFNVQSSALSDVWRRGKTIETPLGTIISCYPVLSGEI